MARLSEMGELVRGFDLMRTFCSSRILLVGLED